MYKLCKKRILEIDSEVLRGIVYSITPNQKLTLRLRVKGNITTHSTLNSICNILYGHAAPDDYSEEVCQLLMELKDIADIFGLYDVHTHLKKSTMDYLQVYYSMFNVCISGSSETPNR